MDDVGLAEFASESGDGDLDGVGEWVDVLVPGLLEEPLGAERGGAGFEQGFEHRALFRGELDRLSVAGDGASRGVKLDPGRLERAAAGRGFAAGERADAQHEFGEVEGFGEVVVGARDR